MSAQEELEKLHSDMDATAFLANRVGDHRYSAQLREWADRIAAIREGLGKAQGEVAWVNLDARFANHERYATTDKEDADDYSASCYKLTPVYLAPPADSAHVACKSGGGICSYVRPDVCPGDNGLMCPYRSADSAQSLEQVAKWAMSEGFATGHAGTMAELLDHLSEQITELRLARDSAQGTSRR